MTTTTTTPESLLPLLSPATSPSSSLQSVVPSDTYDTSGKTETFWHTLRLSGVNLLRAQCACEDPPCPSLAACRNRESQWHDGKPGWLAEDWQKFHTVTAASPVVLPSFPKTEEDPDGVIKTLIERYLAWEKVTVIAKDLKIPIPYAYQKLAEAHVKRQKGVKPPGFVHWKTKAKTEKTSLAPRKKR